MKNTLALKEGQLVYSTAGNPKNPPLMMLHGWCSYRGIWRQTIPALQDDFYCVAVDLLGFGDSDKPDNADYSIEAQGNRVLQLADSLGWDKFNLMGHSMGGQIALCIASMLAPSRVKKLVNVAGVASARLAPYSDRITRRFFSLARKFSPAFSLWRYMLGYNWYKREAFKTWFYNMDAISFTEWAADREMASQPAIRISADEAGKAIYALNLTPHLDKITVPTLTIFGQQDEVVPVSDAHVAEQNIKNSRLVLLDQCGHFPMYEKTAPYLKAVQSFMLNGHSA